AVEILEHRDLRRSGAGEAFAAHMEAAAGARAKAEGERDAGADRSVRTDACIGGERQPVELVRIAEAEVGPALEAVIFDAPLDLRPFGQVLLRDHRNRLESLSRAR